MWANKYSVTRQGADPQKGSPCRFILFVLPDTGLRTYSKESYQNLTKLQLLDAAIQLKNKLYEITSKCLTISAIVYPVHFTQSYNIWTLTEETICYLTFWNIVFSIFSMFMIYRIGENSSVQDRSSSCRIPSPRQRRHCGDFQGSNLQGVTPWMEQLFEMCSMHLQHLKSMEQITFTMHTQHWAAPALLQMSQVHSCCGTIWEPSADIKPGLRLETALSK